MDCPTPCPEYENLQLDYDQALVRIDELIRELEESRYFERLARTNPSPIRQITLTAWARHHNSYDQPLYALRKPHDLAPGEPPFPLPVARVGHTTYYDEAELEDYRQKYDGYLLAIYEKELAESEEWWRLKRKPRKRSLFSSAQKPTTPS